MAQEYIFLEEKSGIGKIALSKFVFEIITDITLNEVENVEKVPSSKFSNSICCKIIKNQLNIIVNVKVKYGANVNATCEILQNKIYQNVLQMTNLQCSKIDIQVSGFHI